MNESDTSFLDSPDPEIDNAIMETKMIPLGQITPNDWNPNVMNQDQYDALVAHIRKVGVTGALQVVPIDDTGTDATQMYRIIDGEHRWRVAKDLGLPELKCDILDPAKLDEDRQKFETIAYQVVHGNLDPERFSRLYDELNERYSRDIIQKQMFFAGQKEFQGLIGDIRSGLPSPEAKAKFDSAEIKTMENLADILNEIYSTYGDTVPYHFLVFAFGKKQHVMIICGSKLWRKVRKVTNECATKGRDINDVFCKLIETNLALAKPKGDETE